MTNSGIDDEVTPSSTIAAVDRSIAPSRGVQAGRDGGRDGEQEGEPGELGRPADRRGQRRQDGLAGHVRLAVIRR